MDIKKYFVYLVVLIVAIIAVYFVFLQKKVEPYPYAPPYSVPKGLIHWHPYLKIMIKGEERYIPDDVGIKTGNMIDTPLGLDMGGTPIHTHSVKEDANEYSAKGRKLHMENLDPASKVETLTLGYFFKVWGKTFNSTCIIDKCNDNEGKVRMFVNGTENFDYDHFFMQDNNEILIKYE